LTVVDEAAAVSSPTEPRLRGEGKDENVVLFASASARVVNEAAAVFSRFAIARVYE